MHPTTATSYYTNKDICDDVPAFILNTDCFEGGASVYDENGYNAATGTFWKDDPICQTWYTTNVSTKNILADLTNKCTLIPPGGEEPVVPYTQFEVDAGACPAGFTENVDCFHQGANPYDPVTGYSDRLGRFYNEDPNCLTWYETEINARGISATLEKNCTITPAKDLGRLYFSPYHLNLPGGHH